MSGFEVVDLRDRPLEQAGTKYWPPQWRSDRWAIVKVVPSGGSDMRQA